MFIWNKWFATTKIAFVNYQVTTLGDIYKANDNDFIKLSEVTTDEIDRIGKYDVVFINAMGIRITEEQRSVIQSFANKRLPILTTSATNPANSIISLDSIQTSIIVQYLSNGGRQNYRSMLNYVRKYVDKKKISIDEPKSLAEMANEMIYHADPKNPNDEELGFNTIAEYNIFLE